MGSLWCRGGVELTTVYEWWCSHGGIHGDGFILSLKARSTGTIGEMWWPEGMKIRMWRWVFSLV